MKQFSLKENYIFYNCENDKEYFTKVEELLKEKGEIVDSGYGYIEIQKENNTYLLSQEQVAVVDENIKQSIKSLEKPYELVYPDYNDTFLNVIAEIRKNYGYTSNYTSSTFFDKIYDKVIILLLDGLGKNILEKNLDETSFLRKHYVKSIHSIYPSTTAAATTSIKSGKSPMVTGWTGWENYIREINRNVVLFTGVNYHTGEPTGVSAYQILPVSMFYNDMNVEGSSIEPNFSKEKLKLKDVLKRSLKINKKSGKSIQYVYFTEPDSIMHEYGSYSNEAKTIVQQIDKEVESYASKLSDNTLLIITADHGHTNVKPIFLKECNVILELLNRKPSNDARCITFSVKDGMHEEFEKRFNALFDKKYKLYKTSEAIHKGFFGLPEEDINPRCLDFLADYVAVAISSFYFIYKEDENVHEFKSHHAGITKDEMMVPICIVKR